MRGELRTGEETIAEVEGDIADQLFTGRLHGNLGAGFLDLFHQYEGYANDLCFTHVDRLDAMLAEMKIVFKADDRSILVSSLQIWPSDSRVSFRVASHE